MRRRIISITTATVCALVVCGIVCSVASTNLNIVQQEGDPRIVAPEEAQVGELVRLNIVATADDYQWIVVPGSPDFEIYAEGQKAVFSARSPGEYLFIAAYCKDNKVSLLRHILTVKGPLKPIVPPGPDSTIAELIPYWCATLKVSDETRETLRNNFSKAAASAAAGEFEDIQSFITATAELNKEASVHAGTAALLDKITEYIVTKASVGELESLDQHILLWNKISAALGQ